MLDLVVEIVVEVCTYIGGGVASWRNLNEW